MLAPPSEKAYMETYKVDGIVCQVAHETIAGFEAELRSVLVDLDVDSPVQKAIEGLLDGEALHDEGVIAGWKEKVSAYPEAVRVAMVETHWRKLFPLWFVENRPPGARHGAVADGGAHRRRVRATRRAGGTEPCVLLELPVQASAEVRRAAGARARESRRADRHVLDPDASVAISALEGLVSETQALVQAHLPEADVTLRRPPGERHQPWG